MKFYFTWLAFCIYFLVCMSVNLFKNVNFLNLLNGILFLRILAYINDISFFKNFVTKIYQQIIFCLFLHSFRVMY